MPAADLKLDLRALKSTDNVKGLSCGDAAFLPLKIFFERSAKQFEGRSLARTYVMREARNPRAIGYITLVCGVLEVEDGQPKIGDEPRYPYDEYPAIKIARLFVDEGYRQSGAKIGSKLVDYGLGVAKDVICPAVGCRFVVVEAKQQSIKFYEKKGFTFLNTATNRAKSEPIMFIDLYRAI